jgi:hypothetical protein
MTFRKYLGMAALLIGALLLSTTPAHAQACAVSVSIATSGTVSGNCFVPSRGQAFVQLTGTWVGTASIEASTDGGSTYRVIQRSTVNTSYAVPVVNPDRRIRVNFTSRTSGTLTGAINYNANRNTMIIYANIPIGPVAYASLGTSVSVTATTSQFVSDINVPVVFQATGMAVLNGATVGTNKHIYALYDVTGALVANTAVAGVTTSGANTFQQIAFTQPVTLPVGRYYCAEQMDGLTDKIRTIATATYIAATGADLTGAAFGTLNPVIVPPTTLTADKGPICYIY